MSNIQAVLGKPDILGTSLFGSLPYSEYLWKNIVIEKRISTNWLHRMYKNSLLSDFWTVLTSAVN